MQRSILALLCLIISATTAVAAPMLQYRVYEDNVLTSLTGSSATGNLSVSGSTTFFSFVSALAIGSPTVASPSLIVQNTSVSSQTGFGNSPHTLRLEVSQTGVDRASAGGLLASLANTLTANILVNGQNVSSVSVDNYADAGNVAYARTTALASLTATQAGNNASAVINQGIVLPNPFFSQTVVITAQFLGAGASVNASSQITVPEPATLGLFGVALLGLGFVRRRGIA